MVEFFACVWKIPFWPCDVLIVCLSFVSPSDKKPSSNPKKKFHATDLRNMHDILSKNMYKIRQRVRLLYIHQSAINMFKDINYDV